MFIHHKRKSILLLLIGLFIASCSQNPNPVDYSPETITNSERDVLGIGSIDIITSDVSDTGVRTASFESGYVDIPSELDFIDTPVTQLTPGTANGVAGRYLLTRVRLRNVSDRTLNNLTLLGISLAGADQSLTPFSNVLTIIGTPVSDANALYQIKPSQPISDNGITNASFVAYAEEDLDSDLRNTISNIPGVSLAAVLPYGFRTGDVAAGQDATVDIGFFIPDGNPVGRFSFRFVAVTDSIERTTQGIDEIDIEGNQDRGYAAVRERFGTPANNKTLVLTGPFLRAVAQADINQNIFTLLPDIRIAGTTGNALATLFDSGLTAIAAVTNETPNDEPPSDEPPSDEPPNDNVGSTFNLTFIPDEALGATPVCNATRTECGEQADIGNLSFSLAFESSYTIPFALESDDNVTGVTLNLVGDTPFTLTRNTLSTANNRAALDIPQGTGIEAGTYTVTINATSGDVARTLRYTLIVTDPDNPNPPVTELPFDFAFTEEVLDNNNVSCSPSRVLCGEEMSQATFEAFTLLNANYRIDFELQDDTDFGTVALTLEETNTPFVLTRNTLSFGDNRGAIEIPGGTSLTPGTYVATVVVTIDGVKRGVRYTLLITE